MELLPSSAVFDSAIHIAWGDVAVNWNAGPNMIQIHLKRSNCAKFGAGSDIVVGCTESTLCPMVALQEYIAARADTPDSPGAFFITTSGQPTTKPWFVAQLLAILAAISLPHHLHQCHHFGLGQPRRPPWQASRIQRSFNIFADAKRHASCRISLVGSPFAAPASATRNGPPRLKMTHPLISLSYIVNWHWCKSGK